MEQEELNRGEGMEGVLEEGINNKDLLKTHYAVIDQQCPFTRHQKITNEKPSGDELLTAFEGYRPDSQ